SSASAATATSTTSPAGGCCATPSSTTSVPAPARSGACGAGARSARGRVGAMEPMLTHKGTVFPWHCDEMGHMNVMWYVGKFDEATRHLFNAIGITPTFVRENKRGMAAVEQTIQYK